MRSVRLQLATAWALYANNLLPYAQLTLANFYAQTTLTIATVCAVNASNLYRMRSVCHHIATACAVYAYKEQNNLRFATVCTVYTSNLLPFMHCMLAIES